MLYTLKKNPEDFLVEEILEEGFIRNDPSLPFIVLKVTKKQMNTLDAVTHLSEKYGKVGYAGLKDKHAITTQYMTIKNHQSVSLKEPYVSERLSYEICGYSGEHLFVGFLAKNKFTITLTDLTGTIKPIISVVNYFGEQRFSENNPQIGESLLRQDYATTWKLIQGQPGLDVAIEHHANNPNDLVGTLRRVPITLLTLFVHAYQSKLWNEVVSEYMKDHYECQYDEALSIYIPLVNPIENFEVPIIGFGLDEIDEKIQPYIEKVMDKYQLSERDFINSSFPQLSKEGGSRLMCIKLEDVTIKKNVVSFSLPKGSYATIVLRHLVHSN